jgi:hypothetical protein
MFEFGLLWDYQADYDLILVRKYQVWNTESALLSAFRRIGCPNRDRDSITSYHGWSIWQLNQEQAIYDMYNICEESNNPLSAPSGVLIVHCRSSGQPILYHYH